MRRLQVPVPPSACTWSSPAGPVNINLSDDAADELLEELIADGLKREPGDQAPDAAPVAPLEPRRPSPLLDAILAGCALYVGVAYVAAAITLLIPDVDG